MLRLITAAVAGFIVLFAGVLIANAWLEEPFFAHMALGIAAFFVVPALVLSLWRPRAPDPATLRTDTFQVLRAVRIEELEDEGLHFLLELQGGRTLFLSGQFLYEPVEAGLFPSSILTIHRDERSDDVVSMECKGKRVTVTSTHPAFTLDEIERGVVPDNFAEFPEKPETVLASIRPA